MQSQERDLITGLFGRMQQFEEEPPEPGEYLGAFRVKNDVFAFVPTKDDKNGKGE